MGDGLLSRWPVLRQFATSDRKGLGAAPASKRSLSLRPRTEDADEEGRPLRRTVGIASLGGATLDNEENYLMKKLYTALGAIQIENQARI